MWSFLVYTGTDGDNQNPFQDLPHDGCVAWAPGERVVLYFANIMNRVRAPWILFLDNWFTSVRLVLALTAMGIYATGTINIWTAMFPQVMLGSLNRIKNGLRGASDWVMAKTKEGHRVMVLLWNDCGPQQ